MFRKTAFLSVGYVTVELPYLYFNFYFISVLHFATSFVISKITINMLRLACIIIEGESAPSAGFLM